MAAEVLSHLITLFGACYVARHAHASVQLGKAARLGDGQRMVKVWRYGSSKGSRESSNGSSMFLSRAAEKVKRTGSPLIFLGMERWFCFRLKYQFPGLWKQAVSLLQLQNGRTLFNIWFKIADVTTGSRLGGSTLSLAAISLPRMCITCGSAFSCLHQSCDSPRNWRLFLGYIFKDRDIFVVKTTVWFRRKILRFSGKPVVHMTIVQDPANSVTWREEQVI